jgi:Holliday junction DNA helicase RuvB
MGGPRPIDEEGPESANIHHQERNSQVRTGPLNPLADGEDKALDAPLRPKYFSDYLGQDKLKAKLRIFVDAAKNRAESLDHVLIHGHPGLGKTTLAQILANEMGYPIKSTSGPVIERKGDLAAILTSLEPGEFLFIDEIHRLNPAIEEYLYPAMEDFKLDLMLGQGPGARSTRLVLNRFTLVGATTMAGSLSHPLRDRFGIQLRLDYYRPDELALIIQRAANLLKAQTTPDGVAEIAGRSRGTPRIAGRLLKRVRDFAEVKGEGVIDAETAKTALRMLDIDSRGLDNLDRRILEIICVRFSGGPVGLETLATAVGEQADTILEVYEPFLIQEGFILRSPRGRLASPLAYEHLGLTPPMNVQNLF